MNYSINPFKCSLSGLDLKDWVWFHKHNNTENSDVVKTIPNVFNLDSEKYYILVRCGTEIKVVEVQEEGKTYDIPCND